MKVTTEPGALAAAVKFAARALTARAAYPILGGLKITASPGGGMEVAAFDHETSARARIAADVGEPGTVLAPGPPAGRHRRRAAPPAHRAGQRRRRP